MRKVVIIGASGTLVPYVIDAIQDAEITLFVRNRNRLDRRVAKSHKVVEGDATNLNALRDAITGQEIVYVNLAGDLETMATNIVNVMRGNGVKRIIAISSIGIYNEPLKSVLIPYRKLADVIESSGLDYTILRPDWFTSADEIDYTLTRKGEPEIGRDISRKSIGSFVGKIVQQPELHVNQNLGISKP